MTMMWPRPRDHGLRYQARDAEGGQHVGAEHRLAILVGHFQERRVLQDPGVVDEEVGLASCRRQLLREGLVIQIPDQRSRPGLLFQALQLGSTAAGRYHLRSSTSQRDGAGAAD